MHLVHLEMFCSQTKPTHPTMLFAPYLSSYLSCVCVWDRRQDLGCMYVRICERVHAWVQIISRMLPSCHAMAVFWRICRPANWAQTPRRSPVSPHCLFSSRSSGLKTESSRRWGSSTKHSGKASVHCWKSTTKDSEKLLRGSSRKKKNHENYIMEPKYLHFLLPLFGIL